MTDSPQRAPSICPEDGAVQHKILLIKQLLAGMFVLHMPQIASVRSDATGSVSLMPAPGRSLL
jgi:hypothetical protein